MSYRLSLPSSKSVLHPILLALCMLLASTLCGIALAQQPALAPAASTTATEVKPVLAPISLPPPTAAELQQLDKLIHLVIARLNLAPQVAKAKWNSKKPITDLPREAVVIEQFVQQAQPLAPELAKRFISAQIEASKMVQTTLHAQWQQNGQGLFVPAPDLETEVRPEIERLQPMLVQALLAVQPLMQQAWFAGAWQQKQEQNGYAYKPALAQALQLH